MIDYGGQSQKWFATHASADRIQAEIDRTEREIEALIQKNAWLSDLLRKRTAQITNLKRAVTLSEAVRFGVVHCSLTALRKASQRQGFPPRAALRGLAALYDAGDLAEFAAGRRWR